MNYNKLGNTDLNISSICLGTMTWGEQNTQEEGFMQMDYALDQGINFFDTAELYAVMPRQETYGKTEEIIGNWFKERKNRDKVILASKIASKSTDDLQWIRQGADKLGFDRKNLDLKGWEIIDQYNNNINFTLNIVAKNDVYKKDTFKIPEIN